MTYLNDKAKPSKVGKYSQFREIVMDKYLGGT